MAQASIDSLAPQKSLIDLSKHFQDNFSLGDDYFLSAVFCDVILVDFIDETSDEKGHGHINRGGIFVPVNAITKAWRKAKVVLAGASVKQCKVGDIVIFPNDKGVSVTNIEVEGYGKIKHGTFLNEERCFGICKLVNANNSTSPKKSNTK